MFDVFKNLDLETKILMGSAVVIGVATYKIRKSSKRYEQEAIAANAMMYELQQTLDEITEEIIKGNKEIIEGNKILREHAKNCLSKAYANNNGKEVK